MGRQIPYFAGPTDDRDLVEAACATGLHLVSLLASRAAPVDPSEYPACYLSLVPADNLHPQGSPPRLLDVVDPMLEFTRSFFNPPKLVGGRIYWNDDNEALAGQTLPHFKRIAGWVRRHWTRRQDDGFYIGPQAQGLLEGGRLELAYTAVDRVP